MVTLSWLNLDSYQLMIRDGGKKMVKYEELVDFIIKNIGGKENVISLTHCVTRLRFQLKDEAKANDEALKSHDGIITVNPSIFIYSPKNPRSISPSNTVVAGPVM